MKVSTYRLAVMPAIMCPDLHFCRYTSNDKKHKTFNYLSNTEQEQSLSKSSDRDKINDCNLCHTMNDELYKTQGDKTLYFQGNDENTPVSSTQDSLNQHMDNYSLPKELQDTHRDLSGYIDSSYRYSDIHISYNRYDYDTRHRICLAYVYNHKQSFYRGQFEWFVFHNDLQSFVHLYHILDHHSIDQLLDHIGHGSLSKDRAQ
jgi:hypothetical protein